MKAKTTKAAMLLVLLISVKCSIAQDVRYTTILGGGSGLVAGEVLQARNGLLTHYVSGTVGSFGSTDQWMGLGQPGTFPVYGLRTQWKSQALNLALRDNGSGPLPDAILEWGNGSVARSDLSIRYILNQSPGGPPVLNTDYFNFMEFKPKSLNTIVGQNTSGFIAAAKFGVYDGNNPTPFTTTSVISTGAVYGISDGTTFNSPSFPNGTPLDYCAGVCGDVELSTSNIATFGVLGIAGSSTGNDWAGYFIGRTFSSGGYTTSDAKLKKEITKEASALEKLMQLKPSQYLFDTEKYKNMHLEKKLQHGFIAQELEKVFPEMVTIVNAPSPVDPKTRKAIDPFSFKAVNYNQLHAVEVAAIQELKNEIEELRNQLTQKSTNQVLVVNEIANPAEAKEMASKAYMLAQNVPNPFTSSTNIKYSIPENKTAMIAVFDLNGKMLLQFPSLKGAAQININGNTLQAGMYLYSLLVNGQEIITKKMILTK